MIRPRVLRPHLHDLPVGDPDLERRLPGGGRPARHRPVGQPERAAMPRAHDAGPAVHLGQLTLVQRAAEVGALVIQDADGVAVA